MHSEVRIKYMRRAKQQQAKHRVGCFPCE